LSGAGPSIKIRSTGAGVVLPVRLTPKSSRDEIVGVEVFGGDSVLKAKVRALPESGRANAALERLIAHWLKVPPSSVKISQGGKSRLKQVIIEGDAATLLAAIAARLAALSLPSS
jgi:uncharacterized protein